MKTIAEQCPALTNNGVTWYRPRQDGTSMWGWTSDPQQADPSYFEEVE